MQRAAQGPSLGGALVFGLGLLIGAYFVFAAIQGDFGLLRRVEIRADIASLAAERDRLKGELDQMRNLTHRLSDSYLDLDLLDQQARDVLGYLRADEVIIR